MNNYYENTDNFTEILLNPPRKSKFRNFISFIYKKIPQAVKDLCGIILPILSIFTLITGLCIII